MRKDKKILLSSAVAFVAIVAVVCILLMPKNFSTNANAIAEAEESVVKVYCYDHLGKEIATGSGFVLFEDDAIVTNYHVVEDVFSVKISTNQDITFPVSGFLAIDKENDIAILKTEKLTSLPPLIVGDSTKIKKGETVTAIGSPMGIKNTVSIGNLSGRIMNDGYDILQFTAPVSSGSSGGALFNEKGQVVGITYASITDGQNLNLAIPIELALTLYDDNKSKTEVSPFADEYWLYHTEEYYTYTYGNPVRVSFDQLQSNPKAYENKMVIVEAYVSSVDMIKSLRMGVYIGDKENITNDADADGLSTNRDKYIYASTYILRSNPLSLGISNSIKIQSGDKVLLTGVFYGYTETGYHMKVKDIKFLN